MTTSLGSAIGGSTCHVVFADRWRHSPEDVISTLQEFASLLELAELEWSRFQSSPTVNRYALVERLQLASPLEVWLSAHHLVDVAWAGGIFAAIRALPKIVRDYSEALTVAKRDGIIRRGMDDLESGVVEFVSLVPDDPEPSEELLYDLGRVAIARDYLRKQFEPGARPEPSAIEGLEQRLRLAQRALTKIESARILDP